MIVRMLVLLCMLLAVGCRRGAARVVYVGPPVAQCLAGRAYMPPQTGTETRVAFVPAVAPAPAVQADVKEAEPADTEADADEAPPEKAKPAKKSKKTKTKKKKKTKKADE